MYKRPGRIRSFRLGLSYNVHTMHCHKCMNVVGHLKFGSLLISNKQHKWKEQTKQNRSSSDQAQMMMVMLKMTMMVMMLMLKWRALCVNLHFPPVFKELQMSNVFWINCIFRGGGRAVLGLQKMETDDSGWDRWSDPFQMSYLIFAGLFRTKMMLKDIWPL